MMVLRLTNAALAVPNVIRSPDASHRKSGWLLFGKRRNEERALLPPCERCGGRVVEGTTGVTEKKDIGGSADREPDGRRLERLRLISARQTGIVTPASLDTTERLLLMTAALADAVTSAEVISAVVHQSREALSATSAALWLVDAAGRTATLVGTSGLENGTPTQASVIPLGDGPRRPLLDAIERGQSVRFASRAQLLELYPHLNPESRDQAFPLVCFPMTIEGRSVGVLVHTYEDGAEPTPEEQALALLVTRHCARAAERVRQLEAVRDKDRLIGELGETARLNHQLIAELGETVRRNELFTAVLGHELRDPLGAIINAARVIKRRSIDQGLGPQVERILSSGKRMGRLVEQLLDFARLRSGDGIPCNPQPMDVGQLSRAVIEELASTFPGRRIDFHPTGDLVGLWDSERLEQAISNLVANALRHGAPESPVVVLVNGRSELGVTLQVANDGTIPADLLPLMFRPFGSPRRGNGGSRGLGLGLYIAKQIVAAHGGTIAVSSVEREGTAFTVSLPRGLPPPRVVESSDLGGPSADRAPAPLTMLALRGA
jgi:signal transduction histidine kinase